jgi:hypothetical protein
MRALVISDSHFGAWTGEDLLRKPEMLALLEPHRDVDEVIFLGDLFDFLFAEAKDPLAAAGGLFDLLREKLQGKRFVFLEGNHDHDLVTRDAEAPVELELALACSSEGADDALQRADSFRRFLEQRLEGVEVEIRYPTYTFGDVLCTHGQREAKKQARKELRDACEEKQKAEIDAKLAELKAKLELHKKPAAARPRHHPLGPGFHWLLVPSRRLPPQVNPSRREQRMSGQEVRCIPSLHRA